MPSKLRVGFLMDSFEVPAWAFRMIEEIAQSEYATIELVVMNATPPKAESFFSKLRKNWDKGLYYLYNRFDDWMFRSQPDAFELKDVRKLFSSQISILSVKPIEKKHIDFFEEKDLDLIRSYNLDVLVRLGFRILRGSILQAARMGSWSFHHGDNRINRGSPAGFWETMKSWPETGSILQILTEDLDNGIVLFRSTSQTDPLSPRRNRNGMYWKTLSFLPRMLRKLYLEGEERFLESVKQENVPINFYCDHLYTYPGNWKMIGLLARHFWKILRHRIYTFFIREQWILLFKLNGGLKASFRRFCKIIPPPDRMWADPHVIYKDGRYYVYIEEMLYKDRRGYISLLVIDENGKYEKPVPVLQKEYHLSYPFVFEWQGEYYMVPETAECKNIQLFKCTRFPDQWEHHMDLMQNIFAYDTTLFYHKNKWWMFTTIKENEGAPSTDELYLFYADTLFTNNWTPHPQNPVLSDVKRARSAGAIFQHQGKWYRPSQNCAPFYGYGVNFNEIEVINENEYRGRLVQRLEPRWHPRIIGTHTLSFQHNLFIVDALYKRSRWF